MTTALLVVFIVIVAGAGVAYTIIDARLERQRVINMEFIYRGLSVCEYYLDAYQAFGYYRCPVCYVPREVMLIGDFDAPSFTTYNDRVMKTIGEKEICSNRPCYLCRNNRYIDCKTMVAFKLNGGKEWRR